MPKPWTVILIIGGLLGARESESSSVENKKAWEENDGNNLCWSPRANIFDKDVFEAVGGRANLVKAWLQPQGHRQMGNFIQLLWSPEKLSQALQTLNWRSDFNSKLSEQEQDTIRYPGLLVTGHFSLWYPDVARFRRRIILSQMAYERFPEYFPEPYGCVDTGQSIYDAPFLTVFAIKSPLATMTRNCKASEYLCFFRAVKNPTLEGRKLGDQTDLTHKKRLSILKSIADAMASLHSLGLTYNKLSFDAIGIQDLFADQVKLYDFEWVAYQGDLVFGINLDYADMERMEAHELAESAGTEGRGFDTASFEADVWSFGIMVWELLANDRDSEIIQAGNLVGTPAYRSAQKREAIMKGVYANMSLNLCYKYQSSCVCFTDLMRKMLELRRVDRLQNFNLIAVALKIMLAGEVISREVTDSFLFSVGLYCSKVI